MLERGPDADEVEGKLIGARFADGAEAAGGATDEEVAAGTDGVFVIVEGEDDSLRRFRGTEV